MPNQPNKRFGRPPKAADPNGPIRSTFSVRLRREVRAKILAASELSGRSISEEIEYRLEQSFDKDNVVDPNSRGLGEIVASTSAYIQASTGSLWSLDRGLARYVHARITLMLRRVMRVDRIFDDMDDDEKIEAEKIEEWALDDDKQEGTRAFRWPATAENSIVLQMATVREWPPRLPDRFRFVSEEAQRERLQPFKAVDADPSKL